MDSSKQILLNAARTYAMMAQELQANGIDNKHYLLMARNCLNKIYSLNNDITYFIKLVS